MAFKTKWVLAFACLSVVCLLMATHFSTDGLLSKYERFDNFRTEFLRSSTGTFLSQNASDVFSRNIVGAVQSFLGFESDASEDANEYHTDDVEPEPMLQAISDHAAIMPAHVPKIAYVFAGSARSFVCPRVHWSIRAHLIDALGGDPHVFVRLSLEDNVNVKTGLGVLKNLDYTQDEVVKVLEILNPRKIQYFTFSNQTVEMQALYPGDQHRVFRENDLRRYSMFFHRCMAYKLVQNYEKEHKMRFDWVVLVRLDAAWLEPVLPIAAYANDRVWITETGYDVFNDQFMLIPRQFSDYMYDLNTKVRSEVYCLGGPDVESWKCDAAQLQTRGVDAHFANLTLAHCCEDLKKGNENLMGMSEAIHKRHLKYGKIPISMARFPVLLTRRYVDGGQNKVICHPECFRIYALNYKEHLYRSGGMPQIYGYMASMEWPDTRATGISARDRVLCYYMTRADAYPWKPISAASPEFLQLTAPADHPADGAVDTDAAAGSAGQARWHIDYTQPLAAQAEHLHPSILQNPKDTEAWRIKPTWNTEGCLTFNFETKSLQWARCYDHSRMKRTRFDSRQLFFVHVVPVRNKIVRKNRSYHIPVTFPESTYAEAGTNITRVLVVDSEPKVWDFHGKLYCLTAEKIAHQAPVKMAECAVKVRDPRQEFTTVRTLMDGSTPQSTLGQLQLAAAPDLCVARVDNAPANKALPRFERERAPGGDELVLKKCDLITLYHLVTFEFELVNS